MINARKKYEKRVNDKYFIPKLIGDLTLFVPVLATLTIGALAIHVKVKLTKKENTIKPTK